MLKEGQISGDEWDKDFFPHIKSGKLKERKDLSRSSFLLVYEIFDTVTEDEDGTLYNVNAWAPPSSEAFVCINKCEE